MRWSTYLFILVSITTETAHAQHIGVTDTIFLLPPDAKPFTIENFYSLIIANHPSAKQAGLLSEAARQEIRLARGNFDPKLEAELLTKKYDGKEYFKTANASLKFPTIFPFDPSVGFERNKGDYLNPERYINNEFNYQQFYAGISIPLGRGLITDDRRTALRQAQLLQGMSEADKVKTINKLLLEAAKEYWQWYYSYYNYRLLNRSVMVAEEIFRRVKTNHNFGEAAVVDTIQAKITWQQRMIEQQESFLEFQNTGLRLSTFLWDSLNNPIDLDITWAPVDKHETFLLTRSVLEELSNQAKANHPELVKLDIKIQQLELDRRLASEYLKPKLNFSYYLLNQPLNPAGDFNFQFNDNHKLGVDFSFPLFLRKERSKLALTKLKLTNTSYDQSITQRQIDNDLTVSYNQLVNIQSILATQRDIMINYERLLNAELLNLREGESDLFKINVQLEKLIQSQSKWLKLLAEYQKQKAYLYWAAGVRNLNGA